VHGILLRFRSAAGSAESVVTDGIDTKGTSFSGHEELN